MRYWLKEDCGEQRRYFNEFIKVLISGARCVTGLEVYLLVWVEATRRRQLLCYLASAGAYAAQSLVADGLRELVSSWREYNECDSSWYGVGVNL